MVPKFGLRNGLLTHTVNAQTPRLLGLLLWRINSVQTKNQRNETVFSEIGLFVNSSHSPPGGVFACDQKMVFYQKFFALNSR